MNSLDQLLPEHSSTIAKNLKINLKRLTEESALDKTEATMALLATATSVEFPTLIDYARAQLKQLDVTAEMQQEVAESAAMMGMLNLYYRFRHMMQHGPDGAAAADNYKAAGLTMTALARPAIGKERFEMLALAVSVINGCEQCITSHEKSLRELGVTPQKIHDLARIAAVVQALKTLSTIPSGAS
jgi:alkyl hydroperoxide reductase subunit D